MDKHTFGDSLAAVHLVTILEMPEHHQYRAKVRTLLAKQLSSLKAITYIPDKVTCQAVLELWHHKFVSGISGKDFPDVIKTHVLNVATTHYRIRRKSLQ